MHRYILLLTVCLSVAVQAAEPNRTEPNLFLGDVIYADTDGRTTWSVSSPVNGTGWAGMTNTYRVAGPVVQNNFGMIEVAWDAKPGPLVTLSLQTADRADAFSYSFALDDLN